MTQAATFRCAIYPSDSLSLIHISCELLDQAASAIESLREVSDAFDGMTEQAEEVRLLAADLRDSVASQGDNLDFSPAEREMVEQRLDVYKRQVLPLKLDNRK